VIDLSSHRGVGRTCGVGRGLGVALGVPVGVGVAVGVPSDGDKQQNGETRASKKVIAVSGLLFILGYPWCKFRRFHDFDIYRSYALSAAVSGEAPALDEAWALG
jgi:hypothetical protein